MAKWWERKLGLKYPIWSRVSERKLQTEHGIRQHSLFDSRCNRAVRRFAAVLISAGLSASSAIYVGAAHYPPSVTSFTSPKPSDAAQELSYVSSAFAFALAAGGLGVRHHILRELGADRGRGLFLAGTVVGLVGIASIITSYIVGFANIGNPHDQSIAVLVNSLGGSTIANVGTAIYAKDASQVQRAWKALTDVLARAMTIAATVDTSRVAG